VNPQEIHARVAERADEFVTELFGERARRARQGEWRVGTRGSLSINLRDGKLLWYDNEAGVGGDVVKLWQRERCGNIGETLRELADWCDVRASSKSTGSGSAQYITNAPVLQPSSKTAESPAKRRVIPQCRQKLIPPGGREGNGSGMAVLVFDIRRLRKLPNIEEWPVPFVITLIRAGLLTAPMVFSERAVAAFPCLHPCSVA
jgi:hypothetical protein